MAEGRTHRNAPDSVSCSCKVLRSNHTRLMHPTRHLQRRAKQMYSIRCTARLACVTCIADERGSRSSAQPLEGRLLSAEAPDYGAAPPRREGTLERRRTVAGYRTNDRIRDGASELSSNLPPLASRRRDSEGASARPTGSGRQRGPNRPGDQVNASQRSMRGDNGTTLDSPILGEGGTSSSMGMGAYDADEQQQEKGDEEDEEVDEETGARRALRVHRIARKRVRVISKQALGKITRSRYSDAGDLGALQALQGLRTVTVLLVGSNGSGKSTIVRCISGRPEPSQRRVTVGPELTVVKRFRISEGRSKQPQLQIASGRAGAGAGARGGGGAGMAAASSGFGAGIAPPGASRHGRR